MDSSNLSEIMKQEFNLLSRRLTHITVITVCLLALIFWMAGVEVQGNVASIVGIVFIGLAAFTLKIPHITYRFMQNKYRNEPDKLSVLGTSWEEFKAFAMRRK